MEHRERGLSERLIFLVAAVLTVGDAVLTYLAVAAGPVEEGNPLLVVLIDRIGLGSAMVVRAIVGVVLLVALWLLAGRFRSARIGLIGVATVLGVVAILHALNYRAFLL